MAECLPEFEYFTVFLKNRNFISKIRISKVTDYEALKTTAIFKTSMSDMQALSKACNLSPTQSKMDLKQEN